MNGDTSEVDPDVQYVNCEVQDCDNPAEYLLEQSLEGAISGEKRTIEAGRVCESCRNAKAGYPNVDVNELDGYPLEAADNQIERENR